MNYTEELIKMNKGFLIILLIALVITLAYIPSALAIDFTWDNEKVYDAGTETIAIWDKGQIGNDTKLVEAKLKTPRVNYVIEGKDRLVAEIELESYWDDYNLIEKIISDWKFYDVNNALYPIEKSITLKSKSISYQNIIDYANMCENMGKNANGTEITICTRKESGSHLSEIISWNALDSKEIVKEKKTTIGIFADVKPRETTEWQFKIKAGGDNGWTTEWAVWTASLDVNLVGYWSFDNDVGSNSTFTPDIYGGNYNGTVYNAKNGTAGIIGECYNYTGYTKDTIDLGTSKFLKPLNAGAGYKNYSLSVWAKPSLLSQGGVVLQWMAGSTNFMLIWAGGTGDSNAGDKWELSTYNGAWGPITSLADKGVSRWTHFVITQNDSTNNFWINGTFVGSKTVFMNTGAEANFWLGNHSFSGWGYAKVWFNGTIDELAIWNRTLTPTEVTQLWNDGTGIQYILPPSAPPSFWVNVTLVSPMNNTNTTNPDFNFNAKILSRECNITNATLVVSYSGGAVSIPNNTIYAPVNSTIDVNFHLVFSNEEVFVWNVYAICSNSTETNSSWAKGNFTINTISYPQIAWDVGTETDGAVKSQSNIPMFVTLTEINFKNITYKVNTIEETFLVPTLSLNELGLPDGFYYYNVTACDTFDFCNTTATRNITLDTTAPTISIVLPSDNSVILDYTNINFNYSRTDGGGGVGSCKYSLDGGANTTLASCNNGTFNTLPAMHTIDLFVNDTAGNMASASSTFFVHDYTHSANQISIGEGDSVVFYLSLYGENINSYYGSSNATLFYKGISYAPDTITRTNQNYTYFQRTLAIPTGAGNSTGALTQYNWTYDIRNSTDVLHSRVTDTKNLTVYNMSLSDCNELTGRIILNMSLNDEELNEFVLTEPYNTTTIEIDLDITSRTNASQIWSYAEKWNNNNSVLICVPNGLLNNTSYKIDFTIGFSSLNRVQEFYYMDNGTLDNTIYFNPYTDNTIDLMDLLTADSTTFLFTFTDEDGLEVDDALVHTFRKYIGEGIFREVERSAQDTNGETHTHLVEEDVIYYFMISQYGHIIYTSDTYNAKCLSTPCSIELSASPSEANWSIIDNEGGKYAISTDKATRIVTIDFALTEPAIVNISLYKYEGGTYTLVNRTDITAMAGSLDLRVPLSYGNATFFVAIHNNGEFVKSEWVDLTESGQDYFGTSGALLGGVLVLSMMLMAITEGAGFIIFTVLALVIVGIMKLVDLNWMALISIICAGGIIVWKLVNREGKTA